MPEAKPVSLHPLTFHEALKALVNVDPVRVGLTPKRRKKKTKAPIENQPKRNDDEWNAHDQIKNTSESAALIKVGETLIADLRTARETDERKQKLEYNRNRRPLWGAFIVTIVYALFAGGQWLTMQNQLNLSERPWVSVDLTTLRIDNQTLTFDPKHAFGSITITGEMKNTGHSVAMRTLSNIEILDIS